MVFETTYDKLLDNITRLKELADTHPLYNGSEIRQIKYENIGTQKINQFEVVMTVKASLMVKTDRDQLISIAMAQGTGAEEQEAKANAALQVLQMLDRIGIRKYRDFSEPKAVFKIK